MPIRTNKKLPQTERLIQFQKAARSVFLGLHLLDKTSPSHWANNWKLGIEVDNISKLHLLQFLVNNS